MNLILGWIGWIVISIFTLGTYTIFVRLTKHKVKFFHQDTIPIKCPVCNGIDEHDNNYVWRYRLRQLIEEGEVSLAPHLCLSCTYPISELDNIPYCTRCFQRLERDGFFDEEIIHHV